MNRHKPMIQEYTNESQKHHMGLKKKTDTNSTDHMIPLT